MVKVLSKFVALAYVAVSLAGCTINQGLEPFDKTHLVLLQFQDMNPGEEIAVIETNKGSFTLRFFPSEAPRTVDNFIELAKQGYFDDKEFRIMEETPETEDFVGFLGGESEANEKGSSIYDSYMKPEISYNLGHFPGAVSSYCPDGDVDSRFFIVGDHTVSDKLIEQIEEANYPEEIIGKFRQEGGYPELWLQSSIFAQVIDGMDIVNDICNNLTYDDMQIKIRKVTITQYEVDEDQAAD